MNTKNSITVESSKVKTLLLVIGGFGFIALGAWFLSLDVEEIESKRRFNSPILIYGVGIAVVGFFGICTAGGIWRFFSSKPGLELTSEGINIFAIGPSLFIPWGDVSGFSVYNVHRQKLLVINLHEPDKYIEVGSRLRRRIAKASYELCGSPVSLSSNSLKLNFKELCELCEEYYQQCGRG